MNTDTESRLSATSASTGTHTRSATVTRYTSTRSGVVVGGVFWGRRVLRRATSVGRRAVLFARETVTIAGWMLLVAAIGGAVLALTAGWIEAAAVAAIAGAMLLVCVPFLLGGHDYRVRLDLERDRVVAGSDVAGSLHIVNRSARVALPGLVDIPVGTGLVEAHVPLLRGGGDHTEQLTIQARRRGVITVGPMTISRGDPVGVLRREISWPEVQSIYVHPVTVQIPSTSAGLVRDLEGTPTSDIVDSDLSFHAIRDYAAGDSQRHIHWKSTAKTGKLMVRQYEETRRSRIALLLDLDEAEYASEDEFELAVSAAASLGVQGIRDGREVLVTASAELPEVARGTVQSIRTIPTITARTMLDGMSEIDAAERVMRLEDVAALTVQSFPDLSIAFLVTGSAVPLARLRAAAIAFPPQMSAVAVRCEPGAEPTMRATRELTVITIGALHDLKHLMARGAVR
ncbi:MAG: DUF58 domain-containing protein [Microbacteriaceae bacterium]